MRILIALTLLQGLVATAAFADNRTLFTLRKPVNPENLVQTYIPVGADCKLGNLDFYWLMNGSTPKPPNGVLRCNILKRLKAVSADPNNKAACPKELPPGAACYSKFYTADEVGKTGQNAPIVIRSVKSASTGRCDVAAFVDLGDHVVQVKQINTDGRVLSQGFTGGTIQFTKVQIVGVDNKIAADWSCKNGCVETISVDMGCQL